MNAATHTFTPDQAVLINLDPRRAPRAGFYVEDATADGKITVRYEVKGQERFADVATAKVTPAEPADTDGIDEAPVDEVPTVDVEEAAAASADDFGWPGDGDAPTAQDNVDRRVEELRTAITNHDHEDDITSARDELADALDELATPEPTPHTVEVRAAARAVKSPKRAPLREGYTTPVGLAKVINERGLYTGRVEGGLMSAALYAYIKNAPAADLFPAEDHDGRNVVGIEAGVAWWTRKNERVATRRVPAKLDRHGVAAELHAALDDAGSYEAVRASVRAIADRLAG